MGMVESSDDAGFLQVRLDILRFLNAFRIWHLDGDGSVQFVIVTKIDLTEPAVTEQSDDAIRPMAEGVRSAASGAGGVCVPNCGGTLTLSPTAQSASVGTCTGSGSGGFSVRDGPSVLYGSLPQLMKSLPGVNCLWSLV